MIDEERDYWHWTDLAHKFHVATDGTCYPQNHPLCALCNPHILNQETKPWEPIKTLAPLVAAPEKTTTAKSAGPCDGTGWEGGG